ncbi:SIMPL domain-containing protein [Bacillus sp. FJAT-49732]|uniref:SIMPL domain-containing protein n=1 Tax=Lederbergia citrisecunda TaxID=2833583 RepID=A0A942YNU6_9BACI|nr:SIMPL domain-containing protein [Lederbergia citrisecunda]MBS4202085.1 SIMPL domain-containing protein [Lederbergia citrisecunda]
MHYQSYRELGAGSEKTRDLIKVIGEGKITVQPDYANVTLGASTENKELRPAQEENTKIISEIKKALNKMGITDKQIQTKDYSIYPQYDYVEGKQEFRTYKVEHLLQISELQIENTGLVVDTAVQHGANTISGMKFEISNYDQYYKKALSLALTNAIEKAETIANTLKVQLNKTPTLIVENPKKQGGPIPLETTAFVKSAATTPIQPGTMEITSTVNAEFQFH